MSKEKKSIIFDGQVFQSGAWERGMGKYSLCLIGSLINSKENKYSEAYIVFTKHLKLNEETEAILKKTAPSAKLVFLDLKITESASQLSIKNLQNHNEDVLSKFVKGLNRTVDFFILSLFIDQVCTVFPNNARNILLFYDLIPLQYFKRYHKLGAFHNYLARFKTIFEADLIFTISQTVADDLSLFLGINKSKIQNIDGAPIERDHQKPKKPNFPLPERFILMPSGNDLRKNNFRAVQAFEQYRNKYADKTLKLVITSYFDEITKNQLIQESDNLIFTGNISEANLLWLYEKTQVVLFVSEYEGLGLPILEAVEAGKLIVCSNLNVFREMSQTAFYYSNQFDPVDIAASIKSALEGIGGEKKVSEYRKILATYTWENSSSKVFQTLIKNIVTDSPKKPKVAVLSPDPSSYSAIGKVVLLLHSELSKYFEIDYFFEAGRTEGSINRPNYLPSIANTFPATEFNAKKYEDYDFVLYHIGNSEFHLETIRNALHLPGYAIIHDTHLKGVFEEPLLNFSYITENRLQAERTLNKLQNSKKTSYLSSIVNNQKGLILHSKYSSLAVNDININNTPILETNLPTATPFIGRALTNKTLTIGFAGIIHQAKGLDVLGEVLKSSAFVDAQIAIFGVPLISVEELTQLESHPNVLVETNLTDFEFTNKLSQLDVLINYRSDYKGETSLSTIEAMRFGVVPFVRNIGWFAELPDDCVIKVSSPKELIEKLEDFGLDIDKRLVMSQKARSFIQKNHTYENFSKALVDFISLKK